MKKLAMAGLCLALVVLMAGCLGSGLIGRGAEYRGSWRSESVEGQPGRVNVDLNLIGTCSIEIVRPYTEADDDEELSGWWSVSGGNVKLKCDGREILLEISDDRLVYSDEDMVVTLRVIETASASSSASQS